MFGTIVSQSPATLGQPSATSRRQGTCRDRASLIVIIVILVAVKQCGVSGLVSLVPLQKVGAVANFIASGPS